MTNTFTPGSGGFDNIFIQNFDEASYEKDVFICPFSLEKRNNVRMEINMIILDITLFGSHYKVVACTKKITRRYDYNMF